MTCFALTPVLAAPPFELYKLIILAIVMLGGAVVKKISEAREQAERAKAAKAPAARPQAPAPRREGQFRNADAPAPVETTSATRRDNPFRNEIEAFLEEVGRRRTPNGPQRGELERGAAFPGGPTSRPVQRQQPPQSMPAAPQRPAPPAGRTKSEAPKPLSQSAPQTVLSRPGAEIAQRKAPVSDDLGEQVRAHLNQYLESSRLSQRARADLGSAVERAVRDHLGTTTTRGPESQDSLNAAAQSALPVAALLRNPAGVRAAVLINAILERPRCLRRKT